MTTQLPYFAYGSNLDLDDLKKWCNKSDQTFPVDECSGIQAILPDYILIFNMYYPGRKGGVLNIQKSPDQAVQGVLYETLPNGLNSLDIKEGVPNYYERKIVTVFTENGTAVKAITYKINPEKTEDHFIRPSDEYANIVLKGSEEFGLDTRMLKATAAGQTAPWMIDRVFTYGTLMKGECREHVLNFDSNIISVHPAVTNGLLYNLGNYPGMIIPKDCSKNVKGELYHLKDMGKSLSILDKIEGFRGYDFDGSLYTRIALKINDHSGNFFWAWTYLINNHVSLVNIIKSGDWRVL